MEDVPAVEGTLGELVYGALALVAAGGFEEEAAEEQVTTADRASLAAKLIGAGPPPARATSALGEVPEGIPSTARVVRGLLEQAESVEGLLSLGDAFAGALEENVDPQSPLGKLIRRPMIALRSMSTETAGRLLDRLDEELHQGEAELAVEDLDELGPRAYAHAFASAKSRAEIDELEKNAPSRSHAPPRALEAAKTRMALERCDATSLIDAIHAHHDATAEEAGEKWRVYEVLLERAKAHAELGQASKAESCANEALKAALQFPDEVDHLYCLAGICYACEASPSSSWPPLTSLLSHLARRSLEHELFHLLSFAQCLFARLHSFQGTLHGQGRHGMAELQRQCILLHHSALTRTGVPLPTVQRGSFADIARDTLKVPPGGNGQWSSASSCLSSLSSAMLLRASVHFDDCAGPLCLASLLSHLSCVPHEELPRRHLPAARSRLAIWAFSRMSPSSGCQFMKAALDRDHMPHLCPDSVASSHALAAIRAVRWRDQDAALESARGFAVASSPADGCSRILPLCSLARALALYGSFAEAGRCAWRAFERAAAGVDGAGAAQCPEALDCLSEIELQCGNHRAHLALLSALASLSFRKGSMAFGAACKSAVLAAEACLAWRGRGALELCEKLLRGCLSDCEAHADIAVAGRGRLALAKRFLLSDEKGHLPEAKRHLERASELLERAEAAQHAEEAFYLLARTCSTLGDVQRRDQAARKWRSWSVLWRRTLVDSPSNRSRCYEAAPVSALLAY